MTTVKQIRQLAWDHEFGLADTEASLFSRERIRRSAAMRQRQRSGSGAQLPSQNQARPQHAATAIAAGVPDLSRHGQRRLQQRGISLDQVLTVLDYGNEQRSHGASRYLLDKRSRALLAVDMPMALRRLPTLDIHVVISDEGTLITAAHRTRRNRRS